MKGRMMAAVLHEPKDLRYEETQIPEIGENEVLIRVRAAGNCGSDLKRIMVEGTYHFPCIPGHEFSGEIAETGRGVKGLKSGDRVTAAPLIPCMKCEWCMQGQYNMCEDYDYIGSRSDGAFAEYVKVPAANVVTLPPGVDFEDGSITDPAAVALHAIRRAGGIAAGETVVVLGAGPIGMLACQWAKVLGAEKVIATDVFEEKLAVASNLGADVAVHAERSDVVQRILAETSGAGADLLIETAGTLDTHVQALLAARKRGRIVHVGRAYRDMLLSDEVFTKIFRKELAVYGAVNSNFSPRDHEWKTVVRYFASGKISAKPLISHRLPLSAIADTFRKMFDKEMAYNKIIFSLEARE
jgi:L-iditol 2-dehydrogenase